MTQLGLLDWQPPADDGAPPTRASFDGETYVHRRDMERLNSIMGSVWRCLRTGHEYTLFELHAAVEADLGRTVAQTSISSKARDLRKLKNGGWPVRSVHTDARGWIYWMEVPAP